MPRDLPGLYWDESRSRYFPGQGPRRNSAVNSFPAVLPNGYFLPARWAATERTRSTNCPIARRRASHHILATHYALSSHSLLSPIPTTGRITAFAGKFVEGEPHLFAGDNCGWLYTSYDYDSWLADINLQPASQITSISISDNIRIATSLGPGAKISVHGLNLPGTQLIGVKNIHDIWSAHLQGTDLALGARKQAALISSVTGIPSVRIFDTGSDVLSVSQQHVCSY